MLLYQVKEFTMPSKSTKLPDQVDSSTRKPKPWDPIQPKQVAKSVDRHLPATMGEINSEVAEALQPKILWAVRKMFTLARTGKSDQRLQFDACKHILDLAGYKPVERVVALHKHDYTPEEVSNAEETLKQTLEISERLTAGPSKFLLNSTATPAPTELNE